jgi:hypothetical protein
MVEVQKWEMKLTPFKISMASNMKSFPLEKKPPKYQPKDYCQSTTTYAASLNTASSNSHSILFPPAPPSCSGITCSLITAHNPSKKGFVPGMPAVHHVLTNLSKRSNLSEHKSLTAAYSALRRLPVPFFLCHGPARICPRMWH